MHRNEDNQLPGWISAFNDEDWQFIKRLILSSGSLKHVAGEYGISYPTVRIRMDRLIEKLKIVDTSNNKSEFHKKLQLMVADGEINFGTAKKILELHNQQLSEENTNTTEQ